MDAYLSTNSQGKLGKGGARREQPALVVEIQVGTDSSPGPHRVEEGRLVRLGLS